MKKIIFWLSILLLSISFNAFSKGISSMYVHRSGGDESIFYFLSQKMPVCTCSETKNKAIDYDYTYLTKTDSVSMLISLRLPDTFKNIETTITSDSVSLSFHPELIYVQPKGNEFEYRLKIGLSFEEFEKLYGSSAPFVISFFYNNSSSGSSISYCYDNKKWRDNSSKISQIINIIKLNTYKK